MQRTCTIDCQLRFAGEQGEVADGVRGRVGRGRGRLRGSLRAIQPYYSTTTRGGPAPLSCFCNHGYNSPDTMVGTGFTHYYSTDTGSELTHLQQTTVTYPASSIEPLKALTHRSQQGAPLR